MIDIYKNKIKKNVKNYHLGLFDNVLILKIKVQVISVKFTIFANFTTKP